MHSLRHEDEHLDAYVPVKLQHEEPLNLSKFWDFRSKTLKSFGFPLLLSKASRSTPTLERARCMCNVAVRIHERS